VPFCDTRPQSDSSAEITPQTLAKWCEQVTIVAPTIDVKNSGADPPAAIHVACKTAKRATNTTPMDSLQLHAITINYNCALRISKAED
jgi:hypothetical protein